MPGEPVVKSSQWSRVKPFIKVFLTILIVIVLLYKVDLRDMLHRGLSMGGSDIFLLLVLTIAQVSVGVFRWKRLLSHLGEKSSFWALYGDVLVGLTYNLFLPTTLGGDYIRALRASRRVHKPYHAWSSSIFERIVGLLAMAASGAIALAIGSMLGLAATIPPVLRWMAVALAVLICVLFFFAGYPFRILVKLMERSLAGRFQAIERAKELIHAIAQDLEGGLSTWTVRTEALFWSLLYQVFGVLFVMAGARALGDSTHSLEIAVGIPMVHILSMLPITIGGFGLREGLFVGVLGLLGVQAPIALGLAAQWLASSVFFALLGAVVLWVPSKHAP